MEEDYIEQEKIIEEQEPEEPIDYGQVYSRPDGSFVITKNEMPYHVPNIPGYEEEYADVLAYVQEHPEMLSPEPEPEPEPYEPPPEQKYSDSEIREFTTGLMEGLGYEQSI